LQWLLTSKRDIQCICDPGSSKCAAARACLSTDKTDAASTDFKTILSAGAQVLWLQLAGGNASSLRSGLLWLEELLEFFLDKRSETAL